MCNIVSERSWVAGERSGLFVGGLGFQEIFLRLLEYLLWGEMTRVKETYARKQT